MRQRKRRVELPVTHNLRPHQIPAVRQIVEAFQHHDVVFVDAPTGSGKTYIGDAVRQMMHRPTMYLCSTKSLQDQILEEFPHAHVLKGRANYMSNSPPLTAEHCTGEDCRLCVSMEDCDYQIAKQKAILSALPVVNYHYVNYTGPNHELSGRELMICDECDVIEDVLMGIAELYISPREAEKYGTTIPKKGVHQASIDSFLQSHASNLRTAIQDQRLDQAEIDHAHRQLAGISRIFKQEEEWVREYRMRGFTMKPIMIADHAQARLWPRGKKWLMMSASLTSVDEIVDSLGCDLAYTTVTVPSTFPIENRPIIIVPGMPEMTIGRKTDAEQAADMEQMTAAIGRIMQSHPDEKILVHTNSFRRSTDIASSISGPHKVITYQSGRERDRALQRYKDWDGPAILVAASLDRGIDLPGDLCRVQVIAKVPYPSPSPQIEKRRRAEGGKTWYNTKIARYLVQATGRGVRSIDDHCVTYILDGAFQPWYGRLGKHLVPGWWREAVQVRHIGE